MCGFMQHTDTFVLAMALMRRVFGELGSVSILGSFCVVVARCDYLHAYVLLRLAIIRKALP